MPVPALRIERVRSDVERLEALPGAPDSFFEGLLAAVSHHGLGFVGACWHLTDPVTGLFTSSGTTGALPGDLASAVDNEFHQDDVAKYSALATRTRPVAGLVEETGGRPRVSARYRHQFVPDGFADELRFAFVDPFGRWGSMGLFSDAAYPAADIDAAAQLVPLVARALRQAAALATATSTEQPSGALILDACDRVVMCDARAAELLDDRARTGTLPGAVHVLAAQARSHSSARSGRTAGRDGTWIAMDANPIVNADEDGGVAIVLRPAAPPSLLELRLRAAGLTVRERQIALAVLRGDSTAAIAARLHLSPWTVQDHLKAVFDKTGVRSRRAFLGQWALSAAPEPDPER